MATNTDIPQGYKATALGIIPQEWEVKTLGQIASIFSGTTPSRENELFFNDGTIPWVKTTDLNNGILTHTEERITDIALKSTTLKVFSKGTVLIAMYGGFNQIGRTSILGIDATINQALSALILNTKEITEYFLLYWLLYRVNKWKRYAASSRKDPNITKTDVTRFPILVPPLAEQRKIAEVLGVWDEAIEKQARLIEKLALRKRALMQRLLSAKLRLPGFSEPWKIHKLQELFTERNETNRTDLPLLSITGDRGVILQTESEKRDTSNDDKSKYKRIAKGDIGYNTMRMWQGRSALSGLEGIVSPAYTIIVPNTTDVDGYYMSVLFKQPRLVYDFWTHSQGLVGDTLNCKYRDFGQVHICCPPLAEQKAITEVLTAADREIELAKEKLERLRRQKRGLMQQLLTGKKRMKY